MAVWELGKTCYTPKSLIAVLTSLEEWHLGLRALDSVLKALGSHGGSRDRLDLLFGKTPWFPCGGWTRRETEPRGWRGWGQGREKVGRETLRRYRPWKRRCSAHRDRPADEDLRRRDLGT